MRAARISFDARMLAVGDKLLREFGDAPLLTVVSVINAARREAAVLAIGPPDPDVIAAVARQRLAEAGWCARDLLPDRIEVLTS